MNADAGPLLCSLASSVPVSKHPSKASAVTLAVILSWVGRSLLKLAASPCLDVCLHTLLLCSCV